MPVVIGAPRTIVKSFQFWLEKINLKSSIELMQKSTLLGTTNIVRKVQKT